MLEGAADEFHHLADPGGVAVGGGDGDDVNGLVHELADVGDDFVAVEFAAGLADGGDGGADDEAELGVARGFAAGLGLAGDALDVGDGDQAAEAILVVDDEHLVDADILREKLVGGLDRVGGRSAFP
jgi:hypothetical protein